MSPKSEQLFKQAMRLPETERERLVARLQETLEPQEDPAEVEAAWAKEIKRRVEEIKSGKAKLIPWEEVYQELRQIVDDAKAKA